MKHFGGTITIGILPYSIERVETLFSEEGERLFGIVEYKKQLITIETGMSPLREKYILMHEALHALDEIYGCFPAIDGKRKGKDVSIHLVEFMRANKDFIKYIIGD